MAEHTRILIVEDNPSDAWVIQTAVGQEGISADYQVVVNGEQALQFIRNASENSTATIPDLLILDLNLPRCSGHEVMREWRSSPLSSVPIVVVTSSDSPRDREMASSYTPYYFCKPLDFDKFMAIGGIVRDVLARQQHAAS